MIKPIVSVIIPVYKVPEEYLRRCIESVIGQTLKEIEIILVDDGSPDNCGAICDEYALKDSRIRVFHKGNGGVSSARNLGLDKAIGKFIMFVDSDDWIENNSIAVCANILKDKEINCVLFGYYDRDKEIRLKGEKTKILTSLQVAKGIAGKYLYVGGFVWNKVFCSSIIKRYNIRFAEDISICEDSLFCHNYIGCCNKIVCLPIALYHYEDNPESVLRTKISKKIKTVYIAYDEIMKLCNHLYNDRDLNNLLWANYCGNYIHNFRRICKEYSKYEIMEYAFMYNFIKNNIFRIVINPKIKLKTKLVALWDILYLKNISLK